MLLKIYWQQNTFYDKIFSAVDGLLSPCDIHSAFALVFIWSAGGGIIKDLIISYFEYLLKKLHKEKTTQPAQVEIVNSIVIFTNIHKDW